MVFLNGQFLEKNQAKITVMDRGFLFGDGVYEVIPVYNKKLFRLKAHLQRLANSLKSVNISNPYNHEKWQSILENLIQNSHATDQSIYLQVTRGADKKRSHQFSSLTPSVYIESNALITKTKKELQSGFEAITQQDFRWQRCDIKSISLLANVMYAQEAQARHKEEILLIRNDVVTEGASSNIFIVKNNTLYTHPTGFDILSGITRDLVIESARACGLLIKEDPFSKKTLLDADEVWISSSTREVMPIVNVDEINIGSGQVGKHWSCVYEHYQKLKYA